MQVTQITWGLIFHKQITVGVLINLTPIWNVAIVTHRRSLTSDIVILRCIESLSSDVV